MLHVIGLLKTINVPLITAKTNWWYTISECNYLLKAHQNADSESFKWAFETKKTKAYWSEFIETVHTTEYTAHVICKHCRSPLKHPNVSTSQSPSSMGRHLLTCHKYQLSTKGSWDVNNTDPPLDHFFTPSDPRSNPVMTDDRVKDKILRIIISGNLPFSFVENAEFIDLLKDAYPKLSNPTRKSLVNYLNSKATYTKEELKLRASKSNSKASLAMDIWTTRTHLAFLGMHSSNLRVIFW